MVFDDKYFTSVDTSSYFTVNDKNRKLYDAASGIMLGESFSPANTALSGVQLAANHGLPTVMISAWEPSRGERGGQGHGTAVDKISELQQKATGEILKVNNMNFTMHAPIVDLMGLSQAGQGLAASTAKKNENFDLIKINMKQADKIAETAGIENAPFCVHSTNSVGAVETKFDSGYRTKDGQVVWGTHNMMVDRESGRVIPSDSTFQYMNINEGNKGGYNYIKGTETKDGVMSLFEITPKRTIEMANATALNEERKKLAEAQIRMDQIMHLKGNVADKEAIVEDLQTTIATAKAKISHLEAPEFGHGKMRTQFVDLKSYSNSVIPEQLAKLAMTSYNDTKTHPVIAVENEPGWQMGSNPKLIINWVEEARKKFAKELVEKKNLDNEEANKKAKELIGVTLDTGHLNTLKSQVKEDGKPYTDDDLKQLVREMGKTGTKLVHIADNIGELGQDTHMMIGRGNVQVAEFLDILKQNGFKGQAQFEAFTAESEFDKLGIQANLMGVGAPMYSSHPEPRFTEVGNDFQTPYALRNVNYGHMLPPLHFSQWGGPFAGLQSTFGAGQAQNKDKFSGTPTE